MEKGRGIFMDQVSAKGQCKATAAMEPANRYSRDQYTQDLYAPGGEGPSKGTGRNKPHWAAPWPCAGGVRSKGGEPRPPVPGVPARRRTPEPTISRQASILVSLGGR